MKERDVRIELVCDVHAPINHRRAVKPILLRAIFAGGQHVRIAVSGHMPTGLFVAGVSFISLNVTGRLRFRRGRRAVEIT
jgi:hypothetical protein